MILSLLEAGKVDKCLVATVAGTGDTLSGDILDMQGFDSVMFIAILGDVAATATLALKCMAGDAANLAGGAYKTVYCAKTATATDCDDKLLILDVVNPPQRYVRPDLLRGVANAVVDGIIAIRYNAKNVPVVQGTDVVADEINID